MLKDSDKADKLKQSLPPSVFYTIEFVEESDRCERDGLLNMSSLETYERLITEHGRAQR